MQAFKIICSNEMLRLALHANEGPVIIQYKCLVSHLCIPRNETVQPPYFQNRIIMFCLLSPTVIYLGEIYIFPGSVCLFCCLQICGPFLGIYMYIAHRQMNVEIRTEAAQFPEKECMNRIFVAVYISNLLDYNYYEKMRMVQFFSPV